jgi:predicted membrane protein
MGANFPIRRYPAAVRRSFVESAGYRCYAGIVNTGRFDDRQRRFHSGMAGMVIGGLIVAAGLVLLLDNLNIIRVYDIWRFWPLALVIFGAAKALESRSPAGQVWGGFIALIGVIFLLDSLQIRVFNFDLIDIVWPLAIIGFGLFLLLRAMDRKRYLEGSPANMSSDLGLWAIFSGVKRRIEATDFKGGDLVAIFGGVNIDLRRATIAGDRAVIDCNALFGGVDIKVPENWKVLMKGMGVFGAFEDKTTPPRPDPNVKTPELVITGAAVFGGVKVDN